MANTTEPSMCGGDAACCRYFDHLFMVADSAPLSSLQCSDPVVWVKGRASGLKKNVQLFPEHGNNEKPAKPCPTGNGLKVACLRVLINY